MDTRQRLSGSGTVLPPGGPGRGAVAVRKPYLAGQVLMLTSVEPFTNEGLRDESTARFVYRVLEGAVPLAGTAELRRIALPGADAEGDPVQSIGGCCARRPRGGRPVRWRPELPLPAPGRGAPGPAAPPLGAMAPTRTMFEQVQALAGLYRRAGSSPPCAGTSWSTTGGSSPAPASPPRARRGGAGPGPDRAGDQRRGPAGGRQSPGGDPRSRPAPGGPGGGRGPQVP